VCCVDPFTIISREAGAGGISLGIEGPSKAVIDFQDKRDGTSDVNYTVTQPGLSLTPFYLRSPSLSVLSYCLYSTVYILSQ